MLHRIQTITHVDGSKTCLQITDEAVRHAQAPEGSPYGYLDSTQTPPQWAYDPDSELAATSGNPLANTLQQIYSGGVSYLIYK